MSEMILVVPDLQCPLHDKRFVFEGLARVIDDNRKRISRVITIGDELDFTSIGRWSEGTPEAFTRALGAERDEWVEVARALRVTDTIRSNHTDRLYTTIMRKAPGLLGVPELELENFMRLDQLGIRFHPKGLRVKDWMFIHGDEHRTSQVSGTSALNNSKAIGLNVCQGHVHRAGLVPWTQSFQGSITRTLWGMEVGHAMDIRKASYTRVHQWQQAFGVLYPTGNTFSPSLIPVIGGRRFIFEGKEYKW